MNAKTIQPLAHPIKTLVPPFPSVDWLSRRLNAGSIPGIKLGRSWVMTDDDVRAALDVYRNTPKGASTGITEKSARRRCVDVA